MPNQQSKYQLLKSLEQDSNLTQRQLSKELGISLGKVNYCLQSLIQIGLVKVHNFKNSKDKIQYSYLLTPTGMEEKPSPCNLHHRIILTQELCKDI